jgi:large conductance mechanosensitive channel
MHGPLPAAAAVCSNFGEGGRHVARIQKIRNARECNRPGGWSDYRRGVWIDCTSLVNDIVMPVIGAVTGGLDFSNYYTALSSKVQPGLSYADAKKQGAVLGWGQFLTAALNFLIIAWVLFLAIKGINRLKSEEPPAPAPGPTAEVKLLTEIRDLLSRR